MMEMYALALTFSLMVRQYEAISDIVSRPQIIICLITWLLLMSYCWSCRQETLLGKSCRLELIFWCLLQRCSWFLSSSTFATFTITWLSKKFYPSQTMDLWQYRFSKIQLQVSSALTQRPQPMPQLYSFKPILQSINYRVCLLCF